MSRAARLGSFIVLTLAILAAGVFIIGSKQYLFSSTYQLKAQFDNVAGLSSGADVEVGGVHSGTVLRIDLPHIPTGKVTVVMELTKSTREIIKQDSVASIETEGVLGNQYLAVSFGSQGTPGVHDGDTIASLPPLVVSDLFKKASSILDSSKQAIANTTEATAHLSSLTAKIDAGDGTVGALVNDKQVYNNLEQTTAGLQKTVDEAQVGVASFQSNMEAMKHSFLLRGFFKKRGYEDSSDLTENALEKLPAAEPIQTYSYSVTKLFASGESVKLKDEKTLAAAGQYLAANPFGLAVIRVSTGMEGDSQEDLVMTQAQALEVRDFLVKSYGFDDRQLKTMGVGKPASGAATQSGGQVQILIYATGTKVPEEKAAPAATDATVVPVQKASAVPVAEPKE